MYWRGRVNAPVHAFIENVHVVELKHSSVQQDLRSIVFIAYQVGHYTLGKKKELN